MQGPHTPAGSPFPVGGRSVRLWVIIICCFPGCALAAGIRAAQTSRYTCMTDQGLLFCLPHPWPAGSQIQNPQKCARAFKTVCTTHRFYSPHFQKVRKGTGAEGKKKKQTDGVCFCDFTTIQTGETLRSTGDQALRETQETEDPSPPHSSARRRGKGGQSNFRLERNPRL